MNFAIGLSVTVLSLVGAVRIGVVSYRAATRGTRALALYTGRSLWRWGNR